MAPDTGCISYARSSRSQWGKPHGAVGLAFSLYEAYVIQVLHRLERAGRRPPPLMLEGWASWVDDAPLAPSAILDSEFFALPPVGANPYWLGLEGHKLVLGPDHRKDIYILDSEDLLRYSPEGYAGPLVPKSVTNGGGECSGWCGSVTQTKTASSFSPSSFGA